MGTKLNLLFFLRKPKNYESGPASIYLRLTLRGKRTEIALAKKILPQEWESKTGRAIEGKASSRALNNYLDNVYYKILSHHSQLEESGHVVTLDILRDRFLGKKEKQNTILEIFREHNKRMGALVGQEYERSTLRKYETCLMHLENFIKWKYNKKDLDLSVLDYHFVSEFEFYLLSEQKCANNTAIKYLKNLGKIIRICLGKGWLKVDPYLNYRPKNKKVNRVVLTENELHVLTERQFDFERLNLVKDIFLFCCYTGLSYVDVKKLKRSEIIKGLDGGLWIYTPRQKTDVISRIPLVPKAVLLLEKYQDHPQTDSNGWVLPVISNQKLNAYLKEIADLCQIAKKLTFHIARHTFATTVTLNNGVPIETVAKMMGHTSIKTTQIYAKVLDHKISEDMRGLKMKF